ncbi:alpha-1,6-mannosyl-glycoprotein 2-beta-N-acetylglucosaminyltransferase [Magnolia sinica]|uniref:alpha-1,6-mannosyl-glycoprotein 2-beta-N-acetylglucosaminyltransferase n=1 Tax=Magnolia sinica TaxID=86752 RepID=UPI002657E99E|nr:alpha-1,6-mannosyl-glycoprotein 2-beta-N-acetylglucosaminyltransferase [Magnolia sinica]XP_058070619.1 alpha-1,6-mannosyl-glycoprotein 2-beta-N-acetylglucosaminyltransferase [Magnolia sinica]XP_058070620.1 alpha-1,6-mannosyl-glycoprotein 2-beta-N-acetylglucosaminyltransferase [Magnolia sinica]XP_058070621.1 alpha-1,6-mannosyl-glycoprotein 2-beta-N-acetylglucosaminyltransferase [Magnolia sinica]
MGFYRKSRGKDAGFRRMLPLVLAVLFGTLVLVYLLRTNTLSRLIVRSPDEVDESFVSNYNTVFLGSREKPEFPKQTELSVLLEKRNQLPSRNLDLFPNLKKDHIKIVLYVHNRPQYLQVVVDSLSKVEGIGETLLIVSHDGYFEEMNKIIESIRFCQVKQIFAPYSPHLFPDSFPGVSPGDCQEKDNLSVKNCKGNADQYGHHRSPKIVSLKHHWWWMMNTVWDGLDEMRRHMGHVLFIEEDHFIFPNAYRSLQLLTGLKEKKCSDCYAANLAPSDVTSKGEGWDRLIAEKIGNVGYAFNRTVWRKIHARAKEFCSFDDYNWDITMWATVYPSWGTPVYTLRGPRRSAAHFGKCGLHQGQESGTCIDNGQVNVGMEEVDKVVNIRPDWDVHVIRRQAGYQGGFKGWGGWGDERDRKLCLDFADMYHVADKSAN